MKYKLMLVGALDTETNAQFPFSDGNSDYAAYLAWLAEGNTPEPYTPTPAELNAPVLAQLAANDLRILRAIAEGDAARIEAHNAAQAALRAQLVKDI